MLFNSLGFLFFLAVFFAAWPQARKRRFTRYLYIVLASFTFYAFWNFRFIFLFIVIGCTDYCLSLAIRRYPGHKRELLVMSVVNTVGWLVCFKYSTFLASNIDLLFQMLHVDVHLRVHVPELMQVGAVGLSFYAFMSMSYVIETYRGTIRPTRNPLHYLAYLSFFPHLLCGPIIRPQNLLDQLKESVRSTESKRWEGIVLISHGFFKKVVIADNMAYFVNTAFASPFNSSGLYWWAIMVLFAAQIYCDFSGYSDIARGLFKTMGYDIPVNFDHPYISLSPREFWQRWHISLSTWFRDYVYIPLGGSRVSSPRVTANLWITFLLSGIWHGAAWHFVVWGGLHAFFVSLERWTQWPSRLKQLTLGRTVALLLTLFQVIVAWVFFRSQDTVQGLRIVAAMFTPSLTLPGLPGLVYLLLLGLVLREAFVFVSSRRPFALPFKNYVVIQEMLPAVLLTIAVYLRGPGNAFIYFQF